MVHASIAVHNARSPRRSAAVPASACIALAVALATPSALGDTGIALDWRAPAECPSQDQIIAKVEKLLGSRKARPAAPIEVTASVSRETNGFRVRIEAQRAEAQARELKGASCAAIANATALILAMMIDPSVASDVAKKTPPNPPDPPAPDAPKPPLAAAPAEPEVTHIPAAPPRASTPPQAASIPPAQAAREPSRAEPIVSSGLLAWAGLDVGSLPGPAAGFGVNVLARYGAQQFEIGAGVFPERSATIPERPSAGGKIGLTTVTAGTCRTLLPGFIELSPCVALELGLMHARGFGVTSTERVSVFWAAARGGGTLAFRPITRLGLLLRIEGVVPLTAPRFLLGGVGEVHKPSPGARGALGISLDL